MRFLRRFFRPTSDAELQEEIEAHLKMDIQERMERGQSLKAAREAARRDFGNVGLVSEVTKDMWGFGWLDELLQDVRFGLRMLRKSPGFTVVATVILTLGIGANAAIFTLVDALLLRDLPVTDPKTLVWLGDQDDCCVTWGSPNNGDYSLYSKQTYKDLRKNLPEFQELAAIQAGFGFRPVVARADGPQGRARSVMGEFVSGNYFQALGVSARLGRVFRDSDDVPGAAPTAVLSYEAWQAEYAGDPAIVGSTFWVNTKAITIAGIAPKGFYGDRLLSTPPELYLPIESMALLTAAPYIENANIRWLYIMGRLRPGVTMSQLQAKTNLVLRQSLLNFSGPNDETRKQIARAHVVLSPGGTGIRAMQNAYADKLNVLMGTSALVLLIACANVANLLLVRGAGRKAEISLRTAIGAKRSRIVAQLLTESVLLSALGGAAGIAVAYGGVKILLGMAFPGAEHLPIEATPSRTVLGFSLGLAFLTGILFGIAPAWLAARAEPADVLRSAGRSMAGGSSWLQRGLVVMQIALSLILLVGAGMFAQSLNKLRGTDLKIATKNRYIVHINPQGAGYKPSQLERLNQLMETRFHALGGVRNVGISSYTPMEDNNNGWGVELPGRPESHAIASVIKANAEYFDSVGTRVVMGRGIEVKDTSASRPVAVVNQTFVKRMFHPGENPLGRLFGTGKETANGFEIVGVVEDSAYTDVRWKDHPMFFVPLPQRPLGEKQPLDEDDGMFPGAIVIETTAPMMRMEEMARQTLASINPNLAVVKFQTFTEQIADRFSDDRLIARMTMFFGVLALLLATVGLYGVTAYGVVRRTSEIGLRMALGAKQSAVVRNVLRGAIAQTVLGLAIGIPAALACVRFVETQLFEIRGADTGLLLTTTIALLIATGLAAWAPARRAAGTDPMKALRME